MTRVMTLIATFTLAAAVLYRSPSDFRMGVSIIVSVAAVAIVVRTFFTGKFVWTLLFLGVLGVFTPFHRTELSHLLISVLDMATLALLAASPIILGGSTSHGGLKHPARQVVITRH
jgi:hypothetical protein